MEKKETKRQHFVPQTYLNKFSIERKEKQFQIFAAPKKDITKVFPSSTEKVCVYKDLYTLPGKTEEERMLIENFYGDSYESKYNRIYELLIDDGFRNISKEDNELIVSSIITMFFRTTRLISEHHEVMYRVFEKLAYLCEQSGKDYFMFENEKIMLKGRSAEQLLNDHKEESRVPYVITQLKVALRLIEIRKNDAISVVKIEQNGPELITSDNPVTLYNFDTRHIAPFDRKNVISLPLNSQYKVIIYPFDNLGYITRQHHNATMSYSEVLTTGFDQLESSERFILGSENGLEEFAKIKSRTEKMPDISIEQKKEIERINKMARELGILP